MTMTEPPNAAAVERARPGSERFSAQLHRLLLPESFFVALGPRFVAAYHESFRSSPHGVALIAWLGSGPVGMLVGTTGNQAHYRWVARHRGLRLAGVGILALLARPALAVHFARTRGGRYLRAILRYALRGRSSTPGADPSADGGQTAVLTHVAVDEAARGHGLGRALVDTFVAEAAAGGAERGELVTDADNHDNHAFYRHCGWTAVDQHPDRDGQHKLRFARRLS